MPSEHLHQSQTLDALKVLYDGQHDALKLLSERSFSTTLQTLTLDVGVVAGLIGSNAALSSAGQFIAIILLTVFHAVVIGYLLAKSRAHFRARMRLNQIQYSIAIQAGVDTLFHSDKNDSYLRSFIGGTGLFVVAVVLSGMCSIVAVQSPLLR